MYLFHATVRCRPGMGPAYAERTVGSAEAISRAPGFISRLLLKDSEHADTYFYISVWRSQAELEHYRGTEYVAVMRAQASLQVLTESVERVECELILEQRADADQAA